MVSEARFLQGRGGHLPAGPSLGLLLLLDLHREHAPSPGVNVRGRVHRLGLRRHGPPLRLAVGPCDEVQVDGVQAGLQVLLHGLSYHPVEEVRSPRPRDRARHHRVNHGQGYPLLFARLLPRLPVEALPRHPEELVYALHRVGLCTIFPPQCSRMYTALPRDRAARR